MKPVSLATELLPILYGRKDVKRRKFLYMHYRIGSVLDASIGLLYNALNIN